MKKLILHIEDNTNVQEVMCGICALIPDVELISRDTASSGVETYLNAVRQGRKPDLIIIDGMLGDTSGWHIIDLLLHAQWGELPPVLAYVGELDEEREGQWHTVGVTEIIKKPSGVQTLVATITRLLAAPTA